MFIKVASITIEYLGPNTYLTLPNNPVHTFKTIHTKPLKKMAVLWCGLFFLPSYGLKSASGLLPIPRLPICPAANNQLIMIIFSAIGGKIQQMSVMAPNTWICLSLCALSGFLMRPLNNPGVQSLAGLDFSGVRSSSSSLYMCCSVVLRE